VENTSEETRSNKNSCSISSEESPPLSGLSASTFGLPSHSHGRCSGKKETPIKGSFTEREAQRRAISRTTSYYATIILNYRNPTETNISGENLRLIH